MTKSLGAVDDKLFATTCAKCLMAMAWLSTTQAGRCRRRHRRRHRRRRRRRRHPTSTTTIMMFSFVFFRLIFGSLFLTYLLIDFLTIPSKIVPQHSTQRPNFDVFKLIN
jgi:hypothetical protein